MRDSGPSFLDAGVPTDNGIEPDNRDNSPCVICDMAGALSKLNVPTAYMRAYKTSMAEYLLQEGFTMSWVVEGIDDAIDACQRPSAGIARDCKLWLDQFEGFGRFP